MQWTPVLIQTIMTIAVMVAIGLAVIGQVRWRATQEWEALADARLQRIQGLEQEIEMLRRSNAALEGTVAEIQRLNLTLQRRVDQSLPLKRERKELPDDS